MSGREALRSRVWFPALTGPGRAACSLLRGRRLGSQSAGRDGEAAVTEFLEDRNFFGKTQQGEPFTHVLFLHRRYLCSNCCHFNVSP